MTILVLASATGAPGVTTSALGLTVFWPRDALLADCDRDPAQVVQAGYLRGTDIEGRGLLALSRTHREGRPLTQEVWLQALPLAAATPPDHRYLPGFTHPGSAALFNPVWPELAAAFTELAQAGTDIIIDAGRIGRDGLPPALVMAADAVLVVVGSSLRSLVALRLHLPGLVDHVESLPGHAEVGLLVVGEGRPYSSGEIAAQFARPVWAGIAHDPAAASVFSDGEPPPRRFVDGPLPRSLRAAATRIVERVDTLTAERSRRVLQP